MDKHKYKFYKIGNIVNPDKEELNKYINSIFKILEVNSKRYFDSDYVYKLISSTLYIMKMNNTQENFERIRNAIISSGKNIRNTRKYLIHTRKSINSPFFTSIFEYLKFKDLRGYVNCLKNFLLNGYKQMLLIEKNWKDYKDWMSINNEFLYLLRFPYIRQLPKDWIETYKLKEFIGHGTKNQGKYNGPDLIFYDKDSKEVGIEIVTYGKLSFSCSSKEINNVNNYFYSALLKSHKYGDIYDSFSEFVYTINKIIRNKLRKKYKSVDRIYLVIIIDSFFMPPYATELAKIIVNKNKEYKKIFAKIIIITHYLKV